MAAPVRLQTVTVRHEPDGMTAEQISEHNLAWASAINASGEAFLSPSQLDGGWIVRVSIGVESTERHHLEQLLELMQQTGSRLAT